MYFGSTPFREEEENNCIPDNQMAVFMRRKRIFICVSVFRTQSILVPFLLMNRFQSNQFCVGLNCIAKLLQSEQFTHQFRSKGICRLLPNINYGEAARRDGLARDQRGKSGNAAGPTKLYTSLGTYPYPARDGAARWCQRALSSLGGAGSLACTNWSM